MQSTLEPAVRDTPAGREAQDVLRKCVHCGFCLATCPTYLVLGDERDSPRGRIYLIKQVLEGATPTATTRTHLDRCLTCRACETTCPSGVEYHKLLGTGREIVEARAPRGAFERLVRAALRAILSRRAVFGPLVALGRALSWLLPASFRRQLLSPRRKPGSSQQELDSRFRGNDKKGGHDRRVLLLQGCVQPALRPNINAAAARVLARLGIAAIEVPAAGCCGALREHLADADGARADMRRLIDAWWPQVEAGAEAIVATASGCGVQLRDYGRLLRDDPLYAGKAARITELARDLAEVIAAEPPLPAAGRTGAIAFQSPCTLQHGQRVHGAVEKVLTGAGFALTAVADPHLCCGSAGTYSILQPALARELRERKLAALHAGAPTTIVTANIGCLTHLAAGTQTPVRHWVELLDE
jgi:glycolate oxidase iron-sulfur subunit